MNGMRKRNYRSHDDYRPPVTDFAEHVATCFSGYPYLDFKITTVGGFRFTYEVNVDCKRKCAKIKGRLLNRWSRASISRNPITSDPILSGGGEASVTMYVLLEREVCW